MTELRAEHVARRIASLYGEVDWRSATGVLHVAAIAAEPRVAIRMGPAAPRSSTDRFVLGFARARADAIVTTGAVLRAEPELVHRYGDDPDSQAAFSVWRERELGRREAPSLVVFSGSGDFPLDHPAIRAARAGFVWTTPEGAARLGGSVGNLSLEVDAAPGATAPDSFARLIEAARRRADSKTISIEAGPSAVAALYTGGRAAPGPPAAGDSAGRPHVDELLLSTYEGPLAIAAVGPPFVSQAAVDACFRRPPTGVTFEEASGPWRFERYRRVAWASMGAAGS
ncbi:MAG: hypothetical protein CL908_11965 [Deltaproteobacteria bacterium]|jgi:riboflavin biosynthesis pyrimidine reductase|nr:hypothetical protein [Deltaproteobacteria bacterium]